MPDTYGPGSIKAEADENGALAFTLTSVEGNALAVTIPSPAPGAVITAAQMESVLVYLLGALTNRTWIPNR